MFAWDPKVGLSAAILRLALVAALAVSLTSLMLRQRVL
jgi:hypothetical protein